MAFRLAARHLTPGLASLSFEWNARCRQSVCLFPPMQERWVDKRQPSLRAGPRARPRAGSRAETREDAKIANSRTREI